MSMRYVILPSGERVPALGIGTWRVGEVHSRRSEEIHTLQLAVDSGAALIDTAEMYGDGRSEELVGEAIQPHRDKVFLVSKVLPSHASRGGARKACEASLRRLRTDRIDLYLLHWRGSVPLAETLRGFEELLSEGKIRYWGVSNFGIDDIAELVTPAGGANAAANQVLYNLRQRGVEWDLLPELRSRRIAAMAYSPFHEGELLHNSDLIAFAKHRNRTPAQIALAWLLRDSNAIAIPKTSHSQRLTENLTALDTPLSDADIAELDRLFPSPSGPQPLAMI